MGIDPTERRIILRHLWACLAFIFLWLLLPHVRSRIDAPLGLVWSIYALALASAALRSWWLMKGSVFQPLSYLFVVGDAIFIGVGVYVTGGIHSELLVLYYLPLLSGALDPHRWGLLRMGGLMVLSLLLATWPDVWTAEYAGRLLTWVFLLFVVGSFARSLGLMEQQRIREIDALREEISLSEERNRFAREIHDGLGHTLVNAILSLEVASRTMPKNPKESEAILQEQIEGLRQGLDDVRHLVFHLRPLSLETEGLLVALEKHLRQFAGRSGAQTEFRVSGDPQHLLPSVELALARIVQEALTNAIKYAHARHITVELEFGEEAIRCIVQDDGQGFDLQELQTAKPKGGFGLHTMRERSERLGGRLDITSAPGQGTRIVVQLPRHP